MDDTAKHVGMIGVGRIGLAVAGNLLASGFAVHGYRRSSLDEFVEAGGTPAGSPAEVAARCRALITCLPSPQALADVISGPNGLTREPRPGLIVIDLGTMPLLAKESQAAALAQAGGTLLDCPLSGIPPVVAARKAVVFASGDHAAYQRVQPVVSGFTDKSFYLGEFGAGSKMKYLANLLVAVHTVAAAEVMVLGTKAGLDPELILKALTASVASSKMLEIRGPMMAARSYRPGAGPLPGFLEVLDMIIEFATSQECPTPLLVETRKHFETLVRSRPRDEDIAAVHAVLSEAGEFPSSPW